VATHNDKKKVAVMNLNVKAKEDVGPGVYANVVRATSGEHDAILDFIMVDHNTATEESADGYLVSRVILANTHLPRVVDMLQKHVTQLLAE
jgi:hypothetical protein